MAHTLPAHLDQSSFNGEWGSPGTIAFFEDCHVEQRESGIFSVWVELVARSALEDLRTPEGKDKGMKMVEDLGRPLPLALQLVERLRDRRPKKTGYVCGLVKVDPMTGEMFNAAADYPISVTDERTLMPPSDPDQRAYSEHQRHLLFGQYLAQRALGVLLVSPDFISQSLDGE